MKDKKVLFVDDDTIIVMTLVKLLTDAGALVETAASYDAGLALLKTKPFDVAIIDLMLPQHTGLEMVAAAKALPGAHPFFVILTNSINAENVADAMEANVTMFIQKADHDPAEIVDMISKRVANL